MTDIHLTDIHCITCGGRIIGGEHHHMLATGDNECVECFSKRSPEEVARIREALTICVTCGAATYGLPRFPGGVQKAGESDMVECILEEVCRHIPAELERMKEEHIAFDCDVWERAPRA